MSFSLKGADKNYALEFMLVSSLFYEKQSSSASKLDAVNFKKWVNEHGLGGYLYFFEDRAEFKSVWKEQYIQNASIWSELIDLGVQFKNLEVCLLKGFSLMVDIYKDKGSRKASDVDLLIQKKEQEQVFRILAEQGYERLEEKKWKGNHFKSLWIKKTSALEVVIELHTQLFWHTAEDRSSCDRWKKETFINLDGFFRLSAEDQLLHLCGHYVFQHNSLKFFWLIDIYEYIKKHQSSLNWERFWSRAQEEQLVVSCCSCIWLWILIEKKVNPKGVGDCIYDCFFPVKLSLKSYWGGYMLARWVFRQHMFDAYKNLLRYYLIKFLTRDSLWDALRYNWHWLLSRLRESNWTLEK